MIQLVGGLALAADTSCYIVGRPRESRGKGIELQSPKFYTSVAQAAQGALEQALRQSVADGQINSLREFIREQERLKQELSALLAPLGPERVGQPRQGVVEATPAPSEGRHIPEQGSELSPALPA